MAQHLTYRTLILGAGAAGLMCAAHAGPNTLVVDHAKSPGEKIRISGGGRCNFTNLDCAPECFISRNPHYAKSALSRYTQWDFLDLVQRHGIAYHEKTLGQLFCDHSAKDIIAMLLAEIAPAELWLSTKVGEVRHDGALFHVSLNRNGAHQEIRAHNLVLATGGLSIPKMGATDLAYRIARQFDLPLVAPRPGLVPLTFGGTTLEALKSLAGLSAPARITTNGIAFDEALLFTHRGLSGPAILQTSSYWREGTSIEVDLDPREQILPALRQLRQKSGRKSPTNALGTLLPARLAHHFAATTTLPNNLADCSDTILNNLSTALRNWHLTPSGTEGYRTAEVTLGGIDTDALDSRTMAARHIPGLYAIGEAVDVTGWLGGYNFQWAWSSGWAAGQAIANRKAGA